MSEPLPTNCSPSTARAAPTPACRPWKGFGINRTTFYRHDAAITTTMLDSAAHQHAEGSKQRRPRRAKMTTATKPSGASAAKTTTYDAISKSTKYTFACSPSKTQHTEPNSNDWLASPT
jgi:hypothetical protein